LSDRRPGGRLVLCGFEFYRAGNDRHRHRSRPSLRRVVDQLLLAGTQKRDAGKIGVGDFTDWGLRKISARLQGREFEGGTNFYLPSDAIMKKLSTPFSALEDGWQIRRSTTPEKVDTKCSSLKS